MSAIITNQFRRNSRELFLEDIGNNNVNSNYFIGIGKSEPWPTTDGGKEESALDYVVPLPTNTINERLDARKNLISLLQVQGTFNVIPLNEWSSGRIYKVYDPFDPNIFNFETIGGVAHYPCYMTHSDNVYVCLKNTSITANNSINTITITKSTVNVTPSGATLYAAPDTQTDGYIWAYVCTLTETSDFYTNQFVDIPDDLDPVTATDNVSDAKGATGGMVYGFNIIDGGTDIVLSDNIILVGEKRNSGTGAIESFEENIRDGGNVDSRYEVTADNGTITNIVILESHPKEYVSASVVVTTSSNEVKETNIQPIVAPFDGFGFSPKSDLPSFYAGVFASYEGNAGGEAPIGVGFRQISLIKNPTRTDNDPVNEQTLNIYDTLPYIELASIANIPVDPGTIITHGTNRARAYLDYVDINTNRAYYHQNSNGDINQKPFPNSGVVSFTIPGALEGQTDYSIDSIGQGEYNQGSGETLFLENRKAILRNNNQQEDIKLVIQF